jgi:DNA-directed RNA polymerase subunit M/transcription elongation factor TFIIS
MNTKSKCAVCGAILSAVVIAEVSNLICDRCGHLSEHLPRENFQHNVFKVNGMAFFSFASTLIITT